MTSFDAPTAVVLDWNLPDHTIRCVEALVAGGIPANRIVVVENGPSIENWSRVTTELADCVLVRIEANVGFARANNIGARALPGRAYLFVNNDAFAHGPESVARLVSALDRPDVGIAVPKLLNADLTLQPTVAPFTTPLPAFVRASGLSRLVPDRWKPDLTTHWDHASSRKVDQAIGAVMLVEGPLWERLGGFRETSFMYAEDLDLCWRAHEEGRSTWFVDDAEFVHLGGASSSTRWSGHERAGLIARAEAGMIREHLSAPRAAAAIAFMRLGFAIRAAWFTVAGNSAASASCRGALAGLGAAQDALVEEPASAPAVDVIRPGGRPAPGLSPRLR